MSPFPSHDGETLICSGVWARRLPLHPVGTVIRNHHEWGKPICILLSLLVHDSRLTMPRSHAKPCMDFVSALIGLAVCACLWGLLRCHTSPNGLKTDTVRNPTCLIMLFERSTEEPAKYDRYTVEVVRPCGGRLPETCRVGFSSLAQLIARSLQDAGTDELAAQDTGGEVGG